MLQLTQLAKDLNIDVPAKMSKRNLCVKLNSLQSAEQAKIIDEKLKLLKNDASLEAAAKNPLVDGQPSEKPIIITDEQLTNIIAPKTNFEAANLQLYRAVLSNDLESAKNALDHGATINVKRHFKRKGEQQLLANSILDDAIASASFELFKLLIDRGAKFSKSDAPLVYNAVFYNKKDILKYLLEHGVATMFTQRNISTVVLTLIKDPDGGFRDLEMLLLLIKYGADINQEVNGFSPLRYAVKNNNIRAVELLLENCAKVTNDAFVAAKDTHNFEIAEILSKHQNSHQCEQNRPQAANVETIVFPTGDVSSIKEDDVSFLPSGINYLVAISYFLQQYKHVCIPRTYDIRWECFVDTCSGLRNVTDTIAKIQSCKDKGVRFIAGFITLLGAGMAHANAYIVDTKDTDVSGNNIITVEIFEPHGSVSETFFAQAKYKSALRDFFTNTVKADRLFFSDEFCPAAGLQAWQVAEKEPKKKFDPLGFCSAWAMWWIHYRLENSTFSRDVLAHQANIHFLKQRKDISITTFIRNYSFFIARHRNVLVETSCKNLVANFKDYENRINRISRIQQQNNTLRPLVTSGKAAQGEVLQLQQNDNELRELEKSSTSDRWIVDAMTHLITHPLANFHQ